MSGPGLTLALAQLLCSDELRARLRSDPAGLAASLKLDDSARAQLLALDPAALDRQAIGLLSKRWGEVSRLIPRSIANLGANARPSFIRHARGYWPDGHRRHLLDALEFLEGLRLEHSPALCQTELRRLRFALSSRRFAVHLFASGKGLPRRHSLQLLLRRGEQLREWIL